MLLRHSNFIASQSLSTNCPKIKNETWELSDSASLLSRTASRFIQLAQWLWPVVGGGHTQTTAGEAEVLGPSVTALFNYNRIRKGAAQGGMGGSLGSALLTTETREAPRRVFAKGTYGMR
jgi:hypothetical protein